MNAMNETVVKVEESLRRCYSFTFSWGWAKFYVDDEGSLLIHSDWGDWSHCWPSTAKAWGCPTFLEFLSDRASVGYLANKMGGHHRNVPDAPATVAGMRYLICRSRRLGELGRESARELWNDAREFGEELKESGIDLAIERASRQLENYFDSLWEWIEHKPSPSYQRLEWLLEVFIEHLRRGDSDVVQVQAG